MCKLKYHTYGEFYDRFVFENDTYKIAFRKDSLSIFEKPDLGTKFIMHDYVDSVCETDLTGVVTNAYPAKVKYRGFDNADTT